MIDGVGIDCPRIADNPRAIADKVRRRERITGKLIRSLDARRVPEIESTEQLVVAAHVVINPSDVAEFLQMSGALKRNPAVQHHPPGSNRSDGITVLNKFKRAGATRSRESRRTRAPTGARIERRDLRCGENRPQLRAHVGESQPARVWATPAPAVVDVGEFAFVHVRERDNLKHALRGRISPAVVFEEEE